MWGGAESQAPSGADEGGSPHHVVTWAQIKYWFENARQKDRRSELGLKPPRQVCGACWPFAAPIQALARRYAPFGMNFIQILVLTASCRSPQQHVPVTISRSLRHTSVGTADITFIVPKQRRTSHSSLAYRLASGRCTAKWRG